MNCKEIAEGLQISGAVQNLIAAHEGDKQVATCAKEIAIELSRVI